MKGTSCVGKEETHRRMRIIILCSEDRYRRRLGTENDIKKETV